MHVSNDHMMTTIVLTEVLTKVKMTIIVLITLVEGLPLLMMIASKLQMKKTIHTILVF